MFTTTHERKVLHKILSLFLCTFIFLSWGAAHAETQIYTFDSPEKEKVFYELATELRCPQCQNNNIAESNAGISADMRSKVYELLQEGYNKKEVVDYMVDRYGNFITYNPPITPATAILWIAPLFALFIGVLVIFYRARKKNPTAGAANAVEQSASIQPTAVKEKKSKQPQTTTTAKPGSSRAFMVWGGILLVAVTAVTFYFTNDWGKIKTQKDAQIAYQILRARATSPNDPFTKVEIQQLAIGLRNELAKKPNNADDWMLLGDVYLSLNAYGEAMQAISRAYEYKPGDDYIKSTYGQLLLMSGDPADSSLGEKLITDVLKQYPNNLKSLSALAFYAYSNKQFDKAVTLWEHMLTVMPADSPDTSIIKRSIAQAKSEYAAQP